MCLTPPRGLQPLDSAPLGPFINYVTLKGGESGPLSVTLCDREGVWSMRIYAWAKNLKHSFISLSHIFTGLSCLVLVLVFFYR